MCISVSSPLCAGRCEPFSSYPRTYDLIHVDGILSLIKEPSSGKNRYECA